MLESFPVCVVAGTLLGFLSGLGIGGGSLLILWLTLVLGMDYPRARGINLMFFLPAAVIAVYFRSRQGLIPWKTLMPAILSGCLLAAITGLFITRQNNDLMRRLFGGLLILTAIRELLWHPKK